MKKYLFILFFILFNSEALASIKKNIIYNLNNIDNIFLNLNKI